MKNLIILLASALAMATAKADTFGTGTNAFTIDFVNIGQSGNAADSTGYGAVPYEYRIGTMEISQEQIDRAINGGLTGVTAGAWSGSQPAAFLTWFEAAAFVNFLNTDRGFTPAYNLSWNGEAWTMSLWDAAQAWTLGGDNSYRHKDAYYFLPSENEWYKAAYYQGGGTNAGYWQYPTAQDNAPLAVAQGVLSGTAVYDTQEQPANVNLSGGLSAFLTRAQGGNVAEWQESAWDGTNDAPNEDRLTRGGDWFQSASYLQATNRDLNSPLYESDFVGLRVASVPEPRTAALLLGAILVVILWKAARRS